MFKKLIESILKIILITIVVICLSFFLLNRLIFSKGSEFVKGYVISLYESGPSFGCGMDYIYEYKGKHYKGHYNHRPRPCDGSHSLGEGYLIQVALSSPSSSHLQIDRPLTPLKSQEFDSLLRFVPLIQIQERY